MVGGSSDGSVRDEPPPRLRTLVLCADLTEVRLVREALAELGTPLGYPAQRVFDMQVAVSEAAANAIEHSRHIGEVRVEIEVFSDRLEVRVIGVGEFHPPSTSARREHRGLGLPLMATLSDHLALYSGSEGGTLVALTFYRPGSNPAGSALPPSLVALLAENSLFEQLLDGLPDSFVVFDRDWRFVYANEKAVQESGLPREQLLGQTLWERFPSFEPTARQAHEVALRERLPLSVVTRHPPSDRWWEARLFPVPEGVAVLARDITESQRSQRRIDRDAAVREGMARILAGAWRSQTEQELGETSLRVAQEVTGSKIAFLADVGPEGLLRDISISNPGWEACTSIAPGHGSSAGALGLHGLYGRVVRDGEPLLTNDPCAHPDSVGLPSGHVPLAGFLAVPLMQDGRVSGILAVGNRPDGYGSDELESLQSLAGAVAEAFSRKRAEDALRHAEARASETRRLSEALSDIDAALIRSVDFDGLMQQLVSLGSAALGSDSAAVSLRQGDRWLVSYVEGLDSAVVGAEMDDGQEAHAVLALNRGEVVHIDDAFDDQRVNRDHMCRWNIRSVLVAPLVGADEALGVIFFNHTSTRHSFSPEEIDFARKLAGTAAFVAEKLPR